jgi:hypothetical protein
MAAGWEIHTPGASSEDVWYAAISDRSEAMEAIAHASGTVIDGQCVRRELSSGDIKKLGLKTGTIKRR